METIQVPQKMYISLSVAEILFSALANGAEIGEDYKAFKSLTRPQKKIVNVKLNNEVVYTAEVDSIRYMKNNNTLILKG